MVVMSEFQIRAGTPGLDRPNGSVNVYPILPYPGTDS